jgi:protein TonB
MSEGRPHAVRTPVLSPLGSLLDDLRRERLAHAPVRHANRSPAEPDQGELEVGVPTPLSPFGALLDQMRERPEVSGAKSSTLPQPRRLASGRLEPELHLETRVVTLTPARRRMSWLLSTSFALHVVVMLSTAVLRLLTPELLPSPTSGVRAFLVEPVIVPPPPPPPAPRFQDQARPRVVRAARDSSAPAFTTPHVTPERIVTDERLDLGIEVGEVGGVEGGVPGGVVGGIVGGLPDTPPPPPGPIRLEEGVRQPRKIKHVDPRYPEIARRANILGVVLLECLVSEEGRVIRVGVVRSSNPLLDEAAMEAVQQWVYTPTLVDGVPVAVILKVTVQFDLG